MHGSGASFSRGEGKAGVVNTDRPSGRRAGVRGDHWSLLVVAPVCAATVGLPWLSRRRARRPLVVPLVIAPACAATVSRSFGHRAGVRGDHWYFSGSCASMRGDRWSVFCGRCTSLLVVPAWCPYPCHPPPLMSFTTSC